ncbi:MAG TPA: hypothetical protein VEI06_06610 [Gemmatimonadaceae bacterium]|nr:hypothetical protein [Gemmatimonadaceae bacterium]
MTTPLALLLWQTLRTATAADTVAVSIVDTHVTWWQAALGITAFVLMASLTALAVVLLETVRRMRRTSDRFHAVLDKVHTDLLPVLARAQRIADNIEAISGSAREEAEALQTEVRRVTLGVRDAVDAAEQRVQELGSLLRVAQDEAEEAIVSAVSALHGVRMGASAFRRRRSGGLRRRREAEELEDELERELDDEDLDEDVEYETRDASDRVDGEESDRLEDEEVDGDDDADETGARGEHGRPRIRRPARRRDE